MGFSAKEVKALRERTGVGMMECKEALKEANGDIEEAVVVLRKKGSIKASKKAGRTAVEGVVAAKIAGSLGVLVEVNSETDFVAKNADFKKFVNLVLDAALEKECSSLECLQSKMSEALNDAILKIGENIKIGCFKKFEGNLLSSYVHGGGSIGVLVKFKGNVDSENPIFKECSKNIALHLAALKPLYLRKEDVPEDVIEKEKEIYKSQLVESKKPSNVIEKIVGGKIEKYYKDNCLMFQQYVKDNNITVKEYIDSASKEIGSVLDIEGYAIIVKGESASA